ncbi:Crp/Fnr family transcriptional regulator [Nitratifractor salsuginis]|uniref:Transcriptional regulator, Crp/Fnr family n=1 Tax=Nitratifractor salsuginis (strain DSM 16511 / JCM 12458 / E9I37-1) TaxID=749222 RepID=E6X117_NITSE|nr:cyclic nucleotide-binding domain-containing protein [Nitratifractor salsuginis]ADV45820.1 putative transcriptional regulator, Crp/Fnr family [Nitratifractor salsuginis DSM 16511]
MEIKSQLFDGLDSKQIEEVLSAFASHTVPKGTVLREEGKATTAAFFLEIGSIRVHKHSSEGEELEIAVIEGGEDVLFSLTSLVDGGSSLTKLITASECTIREIDRKKFLDFCRKHPEIGMVLLKNLTQALARFLRRSDEKIAEMYKTLEEVL